MLSRFSYLSTLLRKEDLKKEDLKIEDLKKEDLKMEDPCKAGLHT